MENTMTSSDALFSQQSPAGQALPGCWKLGADRAVTLCPREDGILRIAHGRLWVTLDGPRVGSGNDSGDHFLNAGEELVLQRGQRVVMEPWGLEGQAPAYFTWDPVASLVRSPLRAASRWQLSVVQPLADLRLALVLGAGAVGRLVFGLVGVATDLVVPRGRGALAARAFNAQSSACRAHGAMS
jgi:hypothetical protein